MNAARRRAPVKRPARLTAAALCLAVALAGPVQGAAPHLVSLPPAIESDEARALSAGLIDLLTSAAGEPFALAVHDNALTYLDGLRQGRYAVVIGGPHVLGALAERGSLLPVAEFKHDLSFVVVVAAGEASGIYQLDDLAGEPVCAGQIPDLFGLALLSRIGNPSREPVMVPLADPLVRIRRLLAGRCRAATLQTHRYLSLAERDGADELRIIHKSRDMPGFGVGVSTDLPAPLREWITAALLSGSGRAATRALAVALVGGEAPLAGGDPDRYSGLVGLMDPYFHDFRE